MERQSGFVNVSDINKKRSSLKNPIHSDEMKKLIDKKNLNFNLETITESKEEETKKFEELRRASLKNEFLMAKEVLQNLKPDEDEEDEDDKEVDKNTQKNQHIPAEDEDD